MYSVVYKINPIPLIIIFLSKHEFLYNNIFTVISNSPYFYDISIFDGTLFSS